MMGTSSQYCYGYTHIFVGVSDIQLGLLPFLWTQWMLQLVAADQPLYQRAMDTAFFGRGDKNQQQASKKIQCITMRRMPSGIG